MPSYLHLRASIVLTAVSLVLFAIGIYGVVQDVRLKLPVSTFAGVLTIAVPVLNLAIIWLADFTLQLQNQWKIASGWLASLLDVALLVLSAAQKWQSNLDCTLESQWQEWYSAKSADSIRQVQDSLSCCGFNSAQDRAWPFQGRNVNATACIERYDGRHTACGTAWAQHTSTTLAISFAIALVALLTKILLVTMHWTGKSTFWSPNRSGGQSRRQRTLPEGRLLREEYRDDEPEIERGDTSSDRERFSGL